MLRKKKVNAGNNSPRAFAIPEALTSDMQGSNRRRACGVNDHAWAMKTKRIRYAISCHTLSDSAACINTHGITCSKTDSQDSSNNDKCKCQYRRTRGPTHCCRNQQKLRLLLLTFHHLLLSFLDISELFEAEAVDWGPCGE